MTSRDSADGAVQPSSKRAFRVFTEEFDRIKPREHNLLGVEIAETVFEPRVGGHVYDRGMDGRESRWARVLPYEPPDRVVIRWDISPSRSSSPRARACRPRTPAFWRVERIADRTGA